jgi:hypothetical protein
MGVSVVGSSLASFKGCLCFTEVSCKCRNPSFGLVTKARGCKVASQEKGSPRVKAKALQGCKLEEAWESSHTPGSLRKCEGVNIHSPKATPILGEGVPVDSRNFRGRVEGSNLNGLLRSLYHRKALETWMSKMGSHCSFGYLKHKLWAKEGPTTKSRESTSSRHPIWECDTALKRSRRGLQLCFRPRRDRTLQSGVMSSQSPGTISGQFLDSNLGVPGKIAIWM